MINAFLLMAIALLLATAPSFFVWQNARRLRLLSAARLEISKSVTQMQDLLANGSLKMGEVCHDTIYQHMLAAQNSTRYPFSWRRTPLTQEQEAFRKRLNDELSGKESLVSPLLSRFVRAYTAAFVFCHPVSGVAYFGYLLITLTYLKFVRQGLSLVLKWYKFRILMLECKAMMVATTLPSITNYRGMIMPDSKYIRYSN